MQSREWQHPETLDFHLVIRNSHSLFVWNQQVLESQGVTVCQWWTSVIAKSSGFTKSPVIGMCIYFQRQERIIAVEGK